VWRRNSLPVRLWMPMAAGLALAAVTAALCQRWGKTGPVWRGIGLAALMIVVFAFQVGSLNAIGTPWVTPGAYVVSPNVTSYFAVSLDVKDPAKWMARYPETLASLPYHAATHPPGFVLFFLVVRKACAKLIVPSIWLKQAAAGYELFGVGMTPGDAAAAIASALLVALLGALGLAPIYLLARQLTGARAAICATCLAAAMPGLLLLGASPDLVIMSLAALALWLGYCAWSGRPAVGALAGLTVAVGLFCSLGFALVAGWAIIWLGIGVLRQQDRGAAVRRALGMGLAGVIGFAIFYLALYLAYDYRPIAVARAALTAHRAVAAMEGVRTYWRWAVMNPGECAIFTGLPLTVAALWSWRALRDPGQERLRMFVRSWLVLAVLLDLSGMVRGEVGRIWLFLMWPAALAASAWLSAREDRARAVPVLVLLQVAQAVMMNGYLTIYSIL